MEADLLRFYRIDLLDFYRGTLSVRRLAVLVKQLPAESALSRALNDGEVPWSNTDHRIADLWELWANKDHPVRAKIVAKVRNARKVEKLRRMRAKHRNMLMDSAIDDVKG